jgi:hypothetical protein
MAQNSVYQTYPQPFGALQYQYSNISVNISGQYFTFFNSVNYSDTNDVAEARGISPYPMGSTLGEYKASGSIEVQKLYWTQFTNLIKAASPQGNSLYDAIFDITVQYQLRVPQGQPQPAVMTDVLKGCRLTGQSMDMSAGNAVLSVKMNLYIALVVWDGILPISGLPT